MPGSSPHPPATAGSLTGLILAGGRARRMGGGDKGLLEVGGRPMIAYVARALEPQVDELLISANRNPERYREICACPVIADTVAGFAGPLAGMAAGLERARHDAVLVVPCDAPLIGADLGARLATPVHAGRADIAVASDGMRMQPMFAVLRRGLLASMLRYLHRGERRVDRWYAEHRLEVVVFPGREELFANINTPADIQELERRLWPGA